MKPIFLFILAFIISNLAWAQTSTQNQNLRQPNSDLSDQTVKKCTDLGLTEMQCFIAAEGFMDCVEDKQTPFICLNAKAGYKECRADKQSAVMCLNANSNYSTCRKKYNASYCLSLTSQ